MRFVAAALIALGAVAGVYPASNSSCSGSSAWTYCEVENSGSSVTVGAAESVGTGDRPGGERPPSGPRPTPSPAPPEDCGPLNRCIEYSVVGIPDVTLADLASFRPSPPTLGGEPAGFGVVGMPTNLVATASEERIPGTVLGWDVTVRFVPTAYVFDHGDGTVGRSTTGGASWTSLGQGQFTPTATSHVYRERGTYDVSVTVEYAASVDFGSGAWHAVPGVVRAAGPGYGVRIVEARTALVDRTCTEDSSAAGC
jgi:hypothetical protein